MSFSLRLMWRDGLSGLRSHPTHIIPFRGSLIIILIISIIILTGLVALTLCSLHWA